MHPGNHALRHPHKPAVILPDAATSTSYGQLDTNATRLAGALRDRGLVAGDVVAILADSASQAFETYWAALRSGLTVTPIDCSLSLEETAYLINDSGARALVVSADLGELATALRPLTPSVEVRLAFGGAVEQHEPYASVVSGAQRALSEPARGRAMFYTAGVTSRPRGVRVVAPDGEPDEHTRRLGALLTRVCGIDSDTVLLSDMPFADALATQVSGAVHGEGGTVVATTRQSPETLLATIQRYRPTVLHLTPAMLVRLLKLPQRIRDGYDATSLRAVIHSGAPCPPQAKQRAIEWLGPIVHEFYSGAERAGMTVIDAEQWLARPGSVGRSVLGAIRICDEDGAELPCDQVGTVYFERPSASFWYHNAPRLTANAQHPIQPNWATMGDLGYLDAAGFLYLVDRGGFVINTKNGPVYPRAVEDLLVMHPRVADAAVVGVSDEQDGQQVRAVVVPADGVDAGHELARELIELAAARASSGAVPRGVDFADTVPRTASGKLTKRALMRKYALADGVVL